MLLVTSYPSLVEVAREPGVEPSPPPPARLTALRDHGGFGAVSPDEVAALYRRARNHDYGLPTEPRARQTVWSSELVRFVPRLRKAHQGSSAPPPGRQLLERWNALHPQHPYANERAMRSSYRQAGARPKGREQGKGTEP